MNKRSKLVIGMVIAGLMISGGLSLVDSHYELVSANHEKGHEPGPPDGTPSQAVFNKICDKAPQDVLNLLFGGLYACKVKK